MAETFLEDYKAQQERKRGGLLRENLFDTKSVLGDSLKPCKMETS
jgi:hypothetical protein